MGVVPQADQLDPELTVMENNAPAIRFYRKFGFQREGVKRNALIVDGAAVNEICMARIFYEGNF